MPSVYASGKAKHSLLRTWRWSLATLLSSPPRYCAGVCTRGKSGRMASLSVRLSMVCLQGIDIIMPQPGALVIAPFSSLNGLPMLPQDRQRLQEILGQRRFGGDDLALLGMDETQPAGVQCLPRHQHLVLGGIKVRDQVGQLQAIAAAVDLVGQHRAADARQVHADLVRAPGARLDAAQRVAAETLQHLVEAARL